MDEIAVCICTYKRESLLQNLLTRIAEQETGGLFVISIVVVDNSAEGSARRAVIQFAAGSDLEVKYSLEPVQNIAAARNRAIADSSGDYLVFVDDDEIPDPGWLAHLYAMRHQYDASGVLGPVLPLFLSPPPAWIVSGGIFERPRHPTGLVVGWKDTRTGNVLLNRRLFRDGEAAFDVHLDRGGEDRDFFRRMIAMGHRFVWCDEAIVREIVPPRRWSRLFLLRRALLRGKVAMPAAFSNWRKCARSAIAICAYLPVLVVLFVVSQGLFMKYLIKLFDHVGLVLGFLGLDVIKEKYLS